MSDTAEYVSLLVISIIITVAVGRVLMMSGQPFLQEVFQDEKVTTSVNRLLSVLFHLITIGVLTIISVWSFDVGTQLQNMVVKLGIVLIVLGIAYGISMLVLIRVREQRRADQISEEVQLKLSDRGISTHPTTGPATTAPAVQPVVPPNGL
jgi:amino acid transporter